MGETIETINAKLVAVVEGIDWYSEESKIAARREIKRLVERRTRIYEQALRERRSRRGAAG